MALLAIGAVAVLRPQSRMRTNADMAGFALLPILNRVGNKGRRSFKQPGTGRRPPERLEHVGLEISISPLLDMALPTVPPSRM